MSFGERIFGERVQEIVEGLSIALDATVDLYDGSDRRHHFLMRTRRWFSSRTPDQGMTRVPGICTLEVTITDRWTLRIFKKGNLHQDAEALADWAAEKLADDLPRGERLETTFAPVEGGGGSSGAAELGIPVSWARKAN
jgi:hypothetical protein